MTLEDELRMMLGRLVFENVMLSKQVKDLTVELETLRGTDKRPE